jgi:hypothetical protein
VLFMAKLALRSFVIRGRILDELRRSDLLDVSRAGYGCRRSLLSFGLPAMARKDLKRGAKLPQRSVADPNSLTKVSAGASSHSRALPDLAILDRP